MGPSNPLRLGLCSHREPLISRSTLRLSQVLTLRDALAASKAALDAATARLGAHDTELAAMKARLERVETNKG